MSNRDYQMTSEELAKCIDHTLLDGFATEQQIRQLCEEAKDFGFCSVCVHPRWIGFAAEQLADSEVKVDSVIGFPFGAELTKIKTVQAKEAIFAGADEIDMVADMAAIVESDQRYLMREMQDVSKVCRQMRPPVVLKVIIESAALTDQQKVFVCRIAEKAGVDFVKTSTGLNKAGGATVEDVRLMREAAPGCKIKAAGGIKTAEQAFEMLEAGVARIGTSSAVAIMQELNAEQKQ